MRREESISQIIAEIQAAFFDVGYISSDFEKVNEPSSPSFAEYTAKIASDRLVLRLTQKLFAKAFNTVEAIKAFYITTSTSGFDKMYFVTLHFNMRHHWKYSEFNHDQLKVNVNVSNMSELHARNAFHALVRERHGLLQPLEKKSVSDLQLCQSRLSLFGSSIKSLKRNNSPDKQPAIESHHNDRWVVPTLLVSGP